MPFTTKMKQGFLEKHQIPDLEQKINKITWNVLLYQKARHYGRLLKSCQKDSGANLKGRPQSKDGTMCISKLTTEMD